MASPRSLDTNVLYLCGEITHTLHRSLTSAFRKKRIQLTVEQFSVLVLLFYKDGINQQEISARLNRDKTTIARLISNMERNKMISRAIDKWDTRGRLIYLTAKGRLLQQKAIAHAGSIYVGALQGVGKRALSDIISVLKRINKNIHATA